LCTPARARPGEKCLHAATPSVNQR
jgi:hypothetical protein